MKLPRWLLTIDYLMAVVYLSWWFMPGHMGNPYLYFPLLGGEIYHVIMAMTFWYTISGVHHLSLPVPRYSGMGKNETDVDIFITVCGEPVEIVAETVRAAKEIEYQRKHIYILNDGYVAKKDNWQDVERLAQELEVKCLTRRKAGGAKAGNINHALGLTASPYVVVFDADHKPLPEFLAKTMSFFLENSGKQKIGFVQTPQYYRNWQENAITRGSWSQQEFFFGPIMQGKNDHNAAFICGTNMVMSRSALMAVGGMDEKSIAEDIVTSQKIQALGYRSVYVPEVLAEGLAPLDVGSYMKQQFRWARGAMAILFSALFNRGLKWAQRIEYFSSALYFVNGIVVAIDISLPLIFFFTGQQVVSASTYSFGIFFLPFISLALYTLSVVSEGRLTYVAVAFAQSLWLVQIRALVGAILGIKSGFSVTPKKAEGGGQLSLAWSQILYMILTGVGIAVAQMREGFGPAVYTNIAWAVLNCALFWPFVFAARGERSTERNVVVSAHPAI